MEYVPYIGLAYMARKESKKMKLQIDMGEVLRKNTHLMRMLGRTGDMFTGITEHQHYMMSHRVIMVPRALGEALGRSNVEFGLSDLRLPHSVFEVVFERGMTTPDGSQMPGLLVMAKPSDATLLAMDRFFDSALGPKFGLDRECQKRMFSIRYGEEDGTIYMANIDYEKSDGKSIEEVILGMPVLRGVDSGLNEEEKTREVYIMRVLMGVLAYMSLDDAEVEACKAHNRPRMGVEVNGVVLGKGYVDRAEMEGHMRDGHFRRLRDERFKRDEEGRVRVIWVRECEVGGKLGERIAKKQVLTG